MDFIKYSDFVDNIENICKKYVGKTNGNAYNDINDEITRYYDSLEYDNHHWSFRFKPGCVVFDTDTNTDSRYSDISVNTDNIGNMDILEYDITWKEDKRSTRGKKTNKILDVTVKSLLPDEFLDWYLADIPQGVHYLIAKNQRMKLVEEKEKLKKQLEQDMIEIDKFENVMKSEAWNKKMLSDDLEEA